MGKENALSAEARNGQGCESVSEKIRPHYKDPLISSHHYLGYMNRSVYNQHEYTHSPWDSLG